LGIIRQRGHFSYVVMALLEPDYVPNVTAIERTMFYLTIIGQIIKTLFVFLGIGVMISVLPLLAPVPWFNFLPWIPLALVLGLFDIACIIGLFQGRDWAFQLTVTMACVGFAETSLAWSPLVSLIAIWIITLLIPCWAKNEFYRRVRERTV